MGFFTSFILIVIAIIALFNLYTMIKHQPDLFSKVNSNKSFTAMGILAIILIGVIGLVVILLRG